MTFNSCYKFSILLLTILTFIGCSMPNFDHVNTKVPFIYYRGTSTEENVEISSDNCQKILNWLKKQEKWKKSYDSYVPVKTIESDCVRINLLDNLVVVSSRKSKNDIWDQFTAPRDKTIGEIFDNIAHDENSNGQTGACPQAVPPSQSATSNLETDEN